MNLSGYHRKKDNSIAIREAPKELSMTPQTEVF
jgi:hypothetical protein